MISAYFDAVIIDSSPTDFGTIIGVIPSTLIDINVSVDEISRRISKKIRKRVDILLVYNKQYILNTFKLKNENLKVKFLEM